LWLVTASAGEWQRADVATALAQRYSFAYDDLDTASALKEIGVRAPASPAFSALSGPWPEQQPG
jgi:hypothetical protein